MKIVIELESIEEAKEAIAALKKGDCFGPVYEALQSYVNDKNSYVRPESLPPYNKSREAFLEVATGLFNNGVIEDAPYHYEGRNFYKGPAINVETEQVDEVKSAFSNMGIKTQQDTLGMYSYVIYSR
jgi:hypothetical protein